MNSINDSAWTNYINRTKELRERSESVLDRIWEKYWPLIAVEVWFLTTAWVFGTWQLSFSAGLFMWDLLNSILVLIMFTEFRFYKRRHGNIFDPQNL